MNVCRNNIFIDTDDEVRMSEDSSYTTICFENRRSSSEYHSASEETATDIDETTNNPDETTNNLDETTNNPDETTNNHAKTSDHEDTTTSDSDGEDNMNNGGEENESFEGRDGQLPECVITKITETTTCGQLPTDHINTDGATSSLCPADQTTSEELDDMISESYCDDRNSLRQEEIETDSSTNDDDESIQYTTEMQYQISEHSTAEIWLVEVQNQKVEQQEQEREEELICSVPSLDISEDDSSSLSSQPESVSCSFSARITSSEKQSTNTTTTSTGEDISNSNSNDDSNSSNSSRNHKCNETNSTTVNSRSNSDKNSSDKNSSNKNENTTTINITSSSNSNSKNTVSGNTDNKSSSNISSTNDAKTGKVNESESEVSHLNENPNTSDQNGLKTDINDDEKAKRDGVNDNGIRSKGEGASQYDTSSRHSTGDGIKRYKVPSRHGDEWRTQWRRYKREPPSSGNTIKTTEVNTESTFNVKAGIPNGTQGTPSGCKSWSNSTSVVGASGITTDSEGFTDNSNINSSSASNSIYSKNSSSDSSYSNNNDNKSHYSYKNINSYSYSSSNNRNSGAIMEWRIDNKYHPGRTGSFAISIAFFQFKYC